MFKALSVYRVCDEPKCIYEFQQKKNYNILNEFSVILLKRKEQVSIELKQKKVQVTMIRLLPELEF